jgi:hypothetical protein
MELKPTTLTTEQDSDDADKIFEVKETAVFASEVPKLAPTTVIVRSPEVGLPESDVILSILGLS